ncbi:MAG: nucleotide sugar dehydrogenase [Rhodospirillales bacterium]
MLGEARRAAAFDSNFRHLCVGADATILEAMQRIEQGGERICFVLDDGDRLLRVVSDGDIRRALIGGAQLGSPARDTHDRRATIAQEDAPEQAIQHLGKRVPIVPVIDAYERVVGVIRLRDMADAFNIRQRTVAVVGLGYVGLTLSLVLADNGFVVKGYDTDAGLNKKISERVPPFYENGLENLLHLHVGNRFRLARSTDELVADIYVITVGTPIIKETLKPNIDHILQAVGGIANKLKQGDLIILRSTVSVGCTRGHVIPLLERESGLTAGKDFHVAFCPERTAEGRALKELRELPQIVGGFNQQSRELAMRFFNENTHTVIDVGSLEAAEMCKLLDNTYRDTVFAYANQMAMLAEKLGLNLTELITKVNLGYGRNKIPYPSPGVGGPCLSKDPYILADNFAAFGLDCPVTTAARRINEAAPQMIFDTCDALLGGVGKNLTTAKVLILGFAFKGEPATSDLRDSTTLWFLDYLKSKGLTEIWGHDPVVEDDELAALGVRPCSPEAGFENADAVFIMNNHRSYSDLNMFALLSSMNLPGVFFDGWSVFPPHEIRNVPGVLYAATGTG